MKKNKACLFKCIPALVLLLAAGVFAQYQSIQDDSLYSYVGVRIDRGPEQMQVNMSDVTIEHDGYYRVWANMVHDSGDEQLNESYFITIIDEDSLVSTPSDSNAGPYKVIADYPGMTSDPVFEDGGLFYLKSGLHTIRLHHYIQISDEYPQFLNGVMGGPHGEAESLYVLDSLYVIAEPQIDAMVSVDAWTLHNDLVNNRLEKVAYPNEAVRIRIKASNNFINDIRFAQMQANLPDSLINVTLSITPDDTINGQFIWNLPRLAPDDTFSVWVDAQIPPVMPEGFTYQNITAQITAPNDIDLSNNIDGDHFWIGDELPVEVADLAITLESNPDSFLVSGQDTLKLAMRDETVPLTITIANLQPDTARNIVVTTTIPPQLSFTESEETPVQIQANQVTWHFGLIPPNSQKSWIYQAEVKSGLADSMITVNSLAQVSADNDSILDNNSDTDVFYIVRKDTVLDMGVNVAIQSDTTITIDSTPHKAVVGGNTFTYEMNVSNNGPFVSVASVLQTIIPESVTISAFSIQPDVTNGDTLQWNFAQFDPDSVLLIGMVLKSKWNLPYFPEKLTLSSEIFEPYDVDPVNNIDSDFLYVLAPPDTNETDVWTTIASTTDTTEVFEENTFNAVFPGDTFLYTIDYGNLGPDDANSTSLGFSVPDYVTLLEASVEPQDGATEFGTTATWNIALLPVSADSVIILQMMLDPNVDSTLQWFDASVIISNVDDTNASNDSDSERIRIIPLPPEPSKNYDAEIIFVAIADSQYVSGGITYPATEAGNRYQYHLSVVNHGPKPGLDILVHATVPDIVTLSDFSKTSESADSLDWSIDSLAVGATWTVTFAAQTPTELPMYPQAVVAGASIQAIHDTVAVNNAAQNTAYILEKIETDFIDVTPAQIAITDSNGTVNSLSYNFAREGEDYVYQLTIQNLGDMTAYDVRVVDYYPQELSIHTFDPAPFTSNSDSIVWNITSIPAGGSQVLTFHAVVPGLMPIGLNPLDNRVTVSAADEKPEKTENNTSELRVYNYVKEPEPFTPLIEALPPTIDVTDSAMIRVQVPVEITSWDLWIYLPNGQVIKDFADNFISNNLLQPDIWFNIDDYYDQPHLYSGTLADDIILEIHAYGKRGNEGIGQTHLVVKSENHMVLDRNVFRPGIDGYVDIKFKLSYERLARLDVFDVSGRLITTLSEDFYDGGWNSFLWNGRLQDGRDAGSGVYLITLDSGEFKDWKKLIIVR